MLCKLCEVDEAAEGSEFCLECGEDNSMTRGGAIALTRKKNKKNLQEDKKMGNRYTHEIDREKIRLLAADKTVPEIAEITGYKINSIRSALYAMGIKAKGAYGCRPKKSSHVVKPEKKETPKPKNIGELTALDMLIAERDQIILPRLFKLNQAIELLS